MASTIDDNGPAVPRRQRRRSSLERVLHSHFMSTLALCSSVFTMFYLLMSVFPYSGFMVMFLVDGVTTDNAGVYAGFLSSSFMIGRAFSAYPWGKLADVYGRKFVLVFSLIVSAVGSVAFGCSTTYAMALIVRFLMGLGNGTMIVCRTAISELARGDKELESKGVGILMSMVGYGMLISPAIGGISSEPVTQFPNANFGMFQQVLETFPFLPPNLIACLLSILSTVFVIVSVEETLPEEKQRPWTHAGTDLLHYVCGKCTKEKTRESEVSINDNSTITSISTQEGDADDWEDDIKILDMRDFRATSPLVATRKSRASYSSALHRPSNRTSLSAEEQDPEKHFPNEQTSLLLNHIEEQAQEQHVPKDETTMAAIFSKPNTRAYLISYWINSFSNVSQSEAFPLFAMSQLGGLGIQEKKIGIVGTLSGLMYCVGQYFVFSQAMKRFGLVQALRWGAFWGSVPVVLIPLSLYMKHNEWVQLVYLGLVMGVLMICNAVYLGCNTIGANRTVDSHQRAAMNGMSSLGTSIGRGFGPIFAGFLVTFAMTSGVLPADFGGWFIYIVLGVIGLLSYLSTFNVPEDGDE